MARAPANTENKPASTRPAPELLAVVEALAPLDVAEPEAAEPEAAEPVALEEVRVTEPDALQR